MMKKTQLKQFISYFRNRLESLDYCNSIFKSALQDEKQNMVDSVKRGNISADDPELKEALSKIEGFLLPTLSYLMIGAVCSFLEETLLRIGMLSFSDFDSEAKKLRNMSTVRKYLKVYQSNMAIDLVPIQVHISIIDDIIFLRNVIMHYWGKIDDYKKLGKLQAIIACRKWVSVTDEGRIFLDDQAYADVTNPVLEIVQYLVDKIPVTD
jgi:hypothetical protein